LTFSGPCRALSFLLVLLGWSAWAQAGGFSNMEFGTRRMGMFAVIAKPDDATAMFHNPAGLVLTEGTTSYMSLAWWLVSADTRLYDSEGFLHPEENIKPNRAQAVNPFLGFTTDFGTKRFRAGIAAYAPNVFGTALPEDAPTRYLALDALFVAARFTGSAAYQVNDQFSVGANINFLTMYLNVASMLNASVLNNPDNKFKEGIEEYDGRLDIEGVDYGISWDVGLLFEPTPGLRLGAMFASGVPVELEGDVTFTSSDGEVLSSTQKTTFAIPFTLQGGINYEIATDFELAADIRYWHYQVNQEQRTTLGQPILGLTGLVSPRRYKNSLNGVGLLHRFAPGWEAMVGYHHDWSPIPPESITVDNPNGDRHGIAAGIRWYPTGGLRVGVAALRNWFEFINNQESQSNPPSNAKGVGTNLALGFDLSWTM
jgi:long-chain fatty acid transport protein